MTIGEALAQARLEAGLSIAQVSQKTRIREAIIRDIERDDYSACGGDFYARGHIRAIARAVGADSEPLIRQYDAIRSGAGQFAPAEQVAASDEFGPDGYAGPDEFGPEEFGPEEFGPDGFAASDGFDAPDEFGPGGFSRQEEAEPYGFAPQEDFDTGGFAAPEEFGPGGFAAPDYLGSGGIALSDEDESAASGESADPGEPEIPRETTAPHQAAATSQMAAFEEIMASRPPAAPERTAPGVTAPGVTARGVTGPGVTGPRVTRPGVTRSGVTAPGVVGPPITGRGGVAPGGTAPPRSHRSGPPEAGRPRRPDRIAVIAAVLALAIFGGLAFLLIPGSRSAPQAGPAAATGPASHRHATRGRQHRATNSPTATPPSTSPAAPASSGQPPLLHPARAVAWGPGGPAHGDNPQDASLAIDGRPRTAWQTDWYTTSHFGNLQAGTGLMLEMGHRVTITSAWITLGRMPGADFQLRVGDLATLPGLRPVAHAANAHGLVRLQPARPARGRYVLIWFTRLPLDPAGTYQARIFNVRLR